MTSGWTSRSDPEAMRDLVAGSINALAFSPNGSQLAAACVRGRLRLWNLSSIRKELADLQLDWDLPAPAGAIRGQATP